MSIPQPKSGYKDPADLVIVCCHATYLGNRASHNPYDEKQWNLAPFQRSSPMTLKRGEHETFLEHAIAGLNAARRRDTSVIFSGGETTSHGISEAESYRNASKDLIAAGIINPSKENRDALNRIICEEWATDSYQNSLFSIFQFRMHHWKYPRNVTVVTHAFKAPRFLDSHAPAIRWPADRIRVQGMNPPFTARELAETQKGERERAYKLFQNDPYGVRSPSADKRRQRGWEEDEAIDNMSPHFVEEEVEQSMRWKGGESGKEIFPITSGELAWPFWVEESPFRSMKK